MKDLRDRTTRQLVRPSSFPLPIEYGTPPQGLRTFEGSQSQNLAVTVLYVLFSLGSGVLFPVRSTKTSLSQSPDRNQAVAFSIQEQLLGRNAKRVRGGLEFKAIRWLYHSLQAR